MQRGKITRAQLLDVYKEEIIKEYTSSRIVTAKSLAQKYNVAESTMRSYLKDCGVEYRPRGGTLLYSLNEKTFENIDTEEKAWALGFIYADGAIVKNKERLNINLSSIDIDVLEKLKNILESNAPIKIRDGITIKNTKYVGNSTVALSVNSSKLCKDLIEKRVVPRKSLILTFPDFLPQNLIRHFVRGYFDGDGSITFGNKNSPKVSMMGTPEFLKPIQQIVSAQGCRANIYQRKGYSEQSQSFEINAKESVKFFLEWLYEDATVYMQRKYNRYYSYYIEGKMFERYKNNGN